MQDHSQKGEQSQEVGKGAHWQGIQHNHSQNGRLYDEEGRDAQRLHHSNPSNRRDAAASGLLTPKRIDGPTSVLPRKVG